MTDTPSRESSRRLLAGGLLLMLACAPLYLLHLGYRGLSDPDEGRNAEVAREMLVSGDYVTPRINDAVYLDKPPAFFWATALSYRLFGVNEFAARFFRRCAPWRGSPWRPGSPDGMPASGPAGCAASSWPSARCTWSSDAR